MSSFPRSISPIRSPRRGYCRLLTAMLLVAACLFGGRSASAQEMCSDLAALRLPDVRIVEAAVIEPGGKGNESGEAPHCRVEGVIGREIRFELLLPETWNGRFAMGGGGGFVGSIQNAARWSVHFGYATVGTDTGHEGGGTDASWALNHPERQINFGHLAVHRTAETAKAIVRAHYGSDIDYSYFLGCSRGGGQALMEAQRYPEDFDGISSGAPAFDWTGIMAEGLQNMQKLYPDPSRTGTPLLSPEHLGFLEKAVLDECDALDGVRDGVMEDPRMCPFDLASLPTCTGNADGDADPCFTEVQLEAIRTVYAPPVNEEGPLYVGFSFGGEGTPGGWINWITGKFEDFYRDSGETAPSLHWAFGMNYAKYLVFADPDWDYAGYDFSSWEQSASYASAFMDATDPDLSDFAGKGHKLVLWHGWSDAALSALASIRYFEEVEHLDPNVRENFRLFMMPGVLHCGGGPGPGEVNWLNVLTDWVEEGKAPDRIVALKRNAAREVVRSRPLCSYPQRAVYDGEGNTDDADSFACAAP